MYELNCTLLIFPQCSPFPCLRVLLFLVNYSIKSHLIPPFLVLLITDCSNSFQPHPLKIPLFVIPPFLELHENVKDSDPKHLPRFTSPNHITRTHCIALVIVKCHSPNSNEIPHAQVHLRWVIPSVGLDILMIRTRAPKHRCH